MNATLPIDENQLAIERTQEILQHLYGTVDQAPTPQWLVKEMVAEVPEELMKNGIVVDSFCGRGTILAEVVARKYEISKTNDGKKNKELLYKIITSEIYGNDISSSFADVAKTTFRRMIGDSTVTINIDNQDSISYNLTMNNAKTKKIGSITNPPYQPMIGVKKGGNEYKKHVLNEISRAPVFGVSNIPMTFMVQDPYDRETIDFRNALLNAGLKKIKHIRPDAYKANVLTVYIVWQQGYTGDVEFTTYDVDDVNKYHSIHVPRSRLVDAKIWPVARDMSEFDLAFDILSHAKQKYKIILNKPHQKTDWCVEWEYLLGLEKERLNRKNPVRGITKRGPTDTVRGGSLSRFVNVVSEEAANSLVEFLATTGQAWQRTIPRGSSVEQWMMGPAIEKWLADNPEYDPLNIITNKLKD